VRTAIDLDHKPMPDRRKIDDARDNRALPAKLESRQPAITLRQPQALLCLRLIFSQAPSRFAGH